MSSDKNALIVYKWRIIVLVLYKKDDIKKAETRGRSDQVVVVPLKTRQLHCLNFVLECRNPKGCGPQMCKQSHATHTHQYSCLQLSYIPFNCNLKLSKKHSNVPELFYTFLLYFWLKVLFSFPLVALLK